MPFFTLPMYPSEWGKRGSPGTPNSRVITRFLSAIRYIYITIHLVSEVVTMHLRFIKLRSDPLGTSVPLPKNSSR
jgi:hypothetical protein